MNFDETNSNASKYVKYMLNALRNDRQYYECDFEYEYTPFEEDIKQYCDSYADFYISNGKGEIFFESLASIVEAVVECETDAYDEDFFRPFELITYYFGKLIFSAEDWLKNSIQKWLVNFCEEFNDGMIVRDYFKPFLSGKKIYHADNYYTGYPDFNKMISVYK